MRIKAAKIRILMTGAAALGASVAVSCAAGIGGGRYMKSRNPLTISFEAGTMRFDEGEVRETRRAYDPERSGTPEYSAYLSSYTIEEMGFDKDYRVLGATLEKQWPVLTLYLNALYANPHTEAVAEMKRTASNAPDHLLGYYIGVEEAIYEGENYKYMWIPNGTTFATDIETILLDAKAKITLFHLGAGWVHLSPWVHFGVYGGYANYVIDAGPAEGVVWYEVPPKQYVVKGKGTGSGWLAIPEIGAGAELRVDFGTTIKRPPSLVVQGEFSWMRYNGSPDYFGIKSRRHVEFNWLNIRGDAFIEIPLKRRFDLRVGATYRMVSVDIDMYSIHRTKEQQEVLNEKYDKFAEFALTQITGNIGLRF